MWTADISYIFPVVYNYQAVVGMAQNYKLDKLYTWEMIFSQTYEECLRIFVCVNIITLLTRARLHISKADSPGLKNADIDKARKMKITRETFYGEKHEC